MNPNKELVQKYATKRQADYSAMVFVGVVAAILIGFMWWHASQVDKMTFTDSEKQQASEMYLNSLGELK